MAKKTNTSKRIVAFDAQGMMGNKTGIGHFSSLLVENLARGMPDVSFVGYYYDFLHRTRHHLPTGSNISYVRHSFVPIQLVNIFRRYRIEIPLELRIYRRADAVLFLNYLSVPSLFKTPGIGFVYDLSFLDHPEYVSAKNQADLSQFVPVTIKRSSSLVTISKFTKSRLSHSFTGLENRVAIVPIPPADIMEGMSELNERLEALGIKKRKYILHVGTIEPRKNIVNLVRAYSLLPERIRSMYSLVLAGGKGWQDEGIAKATKQQQDAGLDIIQTGYVSDAERAALYRHAMCFVLASHYEGFGMPIFEALQHDIPVAVSDIAVFHEVANDAALYFDKDDPADIAEKLAEVLSDKELRKRLQVAGRKQLSVFSWAANVAILRKVLDALQ